MLGIAAMYIFPSTQEYIVEQVEQAEEVIKVETVDALEARIKTAQEGAHASTTAKAQEAYDKVYKAEMKRIEDGIKADYIAEIEETISDASY